MFLPLLVVRQTYGAKRWIVTLQRMCERYNVEVGATCLPRHDLKEVLNDPEGFENVMQISLRMVKRFCEILSMTEKLDFPTSSQFKSEDRVSIRKNEEITQQKGFIVTAATSLWLPLSCRNVFNFLKDNKSRGQWDVLAGGNIVTELARIKTGCVRGNNITIIQPYVPEEKNMLILQESSIDELGAFLIYAPIDLSTVNSIFNGGDAKKVSILPSGFIICPDGRHNLDTYNIENAQNGSILTMAFQILICHADSNSISLKQQKSAVTSVHNLLSSTVLKIRATLGCSD
uniref:Homeobox protein GLABRA2 n=1 Tax=Solanum tuberosum TaxID=4113 RepID=M1B7E7_SOLTU